jgi:hypothetical protein
LILGGGGKNKKIENFNISEKNKNKIVRKIAKVVVRYIHTIKSQYTHDLSLLQMMSPPTPKRKKKGFGFWVLAFGVCEKIKKTHTHTHTHTHTIYTHKLWKKRVHFYTAFI